MATKRTVKKVASDSIADTDIVDILNTEKISTPTVKRGLFGKPLSPAHAHEAMLKTVREMRAKTVAVFDELASVIAEAQESFVKEKDGHERTMVEQKEAWRREQDSYTYERDLKRKKEEDEFARHKESTELSWRTEKAQREQVLIEKENAIKIHETEIRDLEKQAREFPAMLEKAVADASAKKEEEVKESARITAEMLSKDAQREQEIARMKVQNLEDLLKRQTAQTAVLERQLQQAVERAQSLAVTVVEGGVQKRADPESRVQI